jgi:hypothetical protein
MHAQEEQSKKLSGKEWQGVAKSNKVKQPPFFSRKTLDFYFFCGRFL